MDDLPRQKLSAIIAQYGQSLCDDPRRCEALLRDFCGQYRGEIAILVNALKEGVAAELLASQKRVPHEILLAQLTNRLRDNLYMTEKAAKWAVESWALALGIIVVKAKLLRCFKHFILICDCSNSMSGQKIQALLDWL